ncbi:MAG: histidinol-phosphate transaminase [Desulfatitalea sp.]|nr:histidinol-phosphate transaminase [Desulfatitalea sp.]NNJ99933.1 histidinol-phosphate transaminase [Desulfatitalea sp.]
MKLRIPEYIKEIAPYVPGKPIEALAREYGITDTVKLASNENPMGPSPKALAALQHVMADLHRYPDEPPYVLTRRLAEKFQVADNQVVLGNGSDELLEMLGRCLLQPGDEVIIPHPSFLMYTIVARSAGAVPVMVPLKHMTLDLDAMAASVTPRTRLIFVCNPNNPTGTVVSGPALAAFLAKVPEQVAVVVDEAYFEFVRDDTCRSGMTYLADDPRVVTLRTFSKAYGLAGLRVGYGVMAAPLADMLHRVRMPFNVNAPAQAAAVAALDDHEFLARTIANTHQGLDFLYAQLNRRGLQAFPSQGNFFLIDLGRPADQVYEAMLRHGVIVRPMNGYGYPNTIRLTVGLPEENQRFLIALDAVLAGESAS